MYMRRRGDVIEGILVPFATADDDSYGTFWDRRTDFALRMFYPQAVLHFHGLLEGVQLKREGEFEKFGIEPGAGLWARARLNPRSVLHDVLESGRAAWSSAAVPHLIKVDRHTGYVRSWPIFEGSIGDVSQVSARRELTRAHYARAGIEIPHDFLRRSQWTGAIDMQLEDVFPADGDTKPEDDKEEVKAVVKDGEPGDKDEGGANTEVEKGAESESESPALEPTEIASVVEAAIRGVLGSVNGPKPADKSEPATRSAAKGDLDVVKPKTPNIRVASEWDGINLLGMAFHHEASKVVGVNRMDAGIDERYYRAMADKVEKQYEQDQKVDDSPIVAGRYRLERLGIRGIDDRVFKQWHRRAPYLRADEAMLSTLANHGDELVPTLLGSMLYYFIRLNSRLAQVLDTFRQPSNPFDYPKVTSGPEFRKGEELEDATNYNVANAKIAYSKVGTGDVRFTAGKAEALTLYSRELVEDSGVNLSQAVANAYVEEMAHALDWILVNGDRSANQTNISYWGTSPAGVTNYDRALSLDGIRHGIVAADQTQVANLADDSILTIMKTMGPRGVIGRDIGNLICVMPPEVAYKLDALAAYESLEKVGSQATLLRGQLGFWRSVPVLVTEEMELTNTNGRIDDTVASNTKGSFLVIHRGAVKIGMVRPPEIEQAKIPGVDGSFIHGTMRLDVNLLEAGAAAYAYNVTV